MGVSLLSARKAINSKTKLSTLPVLIEPLNYNIFEQPKHRCNKTLKPPGVKIKNLYFFKLLDKLKRPMLYINKSYETMDLIEK